jgi:hypothetical protein
MSGFERRRHPGMIRASESRLNRVDGLVDEAGYPLNNVNDVQRMRRPGLGTNGRHGLTHGLTTASLGNTSCCCHSVRKTIRQLAH